ncbi:MAG TPA: TetR/AcrR family transcriptional regulator [Polyangiales bacterium]|nr:TetR/AcrR family transcriptional regulator [Polyangiales bacterium]
MTREKRSLDLPADSGHLSEIVQAKEPRPSMRYKKSEISVSHIVEAAIRVLARQGYAHSSLMDIANEVGMSKGAVHYHFPTKEALITQVLETACETVQERTLKAWTQSEDPLASIRSALHVLWHSHAELSDEGKVVADLLAQCLHDEKLRPPLATYYRFAVSQVEEHLRTNAEALGLRSKIDHQFLPRVLHALLDGFLLQRIFDPEAVTDAQVIHALETIAASLFEFAPKAEAAPEPAPASE